MPRPSTLSPEFDPELTTCLFCPTGELAPYDRDFRGITIVRCRTCGLLFMNPQYSDDYLAAYYGAGQYIPPFDFTQVERHANYPSALPRLERLRAVAPEGRFLSFGSGDGFELYLARELGWEVEGYEIDELRAASIRESLGVPFHSGDFFEAPIPRERFAVIYLDQVLEHLKRPRPTLERLRELLEPGGVLYLGLPNIAGLSNRWKTAMGRLGLKRQRGKHYDTFHHVAYYQPRVLERLMTGQLGFETVRIEGEPPPTAGPLAAAVERRACSGSTFVGLFRKPLG